MEKIENNIQISFNIKDVLGKFISSFLPEKIFLLTDENTFKYCYPIIKDVFKEKANIITIKSGEANKNINTIHIIWDFLFENKADKKSLLINLGGGVITDMGGFAASTFKRGISFINIPTTLLAQIDASIGGKTGINYANLKNEIGLINFPQKVFIDSVFIKTQEYDEVLSGFAEMLKHAMISDKKHLDELFAFYPKKKQGTDNKMLMHLIEKSVKIKENIVNSDPYEKGIRKALNFGHTFGHAFESHFAEKNNRIKHGEAVAQGIICELFLSNKKRDFDLKNFLYYSEKIMYLFGKKIICNNDIENLIKYMLHDKKNTGNKINCTLLNDIGKPVIDNVITKNEAKDVLNFYIQLSK